MEHPEDEHDPAEAPRHDVDPSTHVAHPHPLSPADTRAAALGSCVGTWWQLTSFLSVEGGQAVEFLDGITTRSIERIPVGSAAITLFLTPKARIIAPAVAYRAAEDRVLLELDPEHVEVLASHLKKYRLRAKATITVEELGSVSVLGPDSARIAAGGDGDGWFETPAWGLDARTFVGTRAAAAELVNTTFPAEGVPLADPEALDALRIERGAPVLCDLLVDHMPAEVGAMDVAVTLDKGCYLGQEPVARLHYRGKANRSLRRVRLEQAIPDEYGDGTTDGAPQVGDEDWLALRAPGDAGDGRVLGRLTSWATGADGERVGLAVMRREVEVGTALVLSGTDVQVVPAD